MKVLFCSNPLCKNEVDIDYQNEYRVADRFGIAAGLLDFEALVYDKDVCKAIRRVPSSDVPQQVVYRGWMLTPADYEKMYVGLAQKNINLITSPSQYKHCHYLPETYSIIKDVSPRSIWFTKEELGETYVGQVANEFGKKTIMIKDYVKSRKHDWNEACYIPDASDANKVSEIVNNFLRLQGEDLNEGVIFREFVQLKYLTSHSISKMPIPLEYRIFFMKGEPIQVINYWEEGEYGSQIPDITRFCNIAKNIQSDFFSMDIAQKTDGNWIIIEVGDGQVSGLPEKTDIEGFYEKVKITGQ